MEAKNPGNLLRTTVDHKTRKIFPSGVNLCLRNAVSMSELESAESFDSKPRFSFWTRDSNSVGSCQVGFHSQQNTKLLQRVTNCTVGVSSCTMQWMCSKFN